MLSTFTSSLALLAATAPFAIATGPLRLRAGQLGTPGQNASYDYVVVGGGTAGLTIAARLAESYSVAVIEAGYYYEIDYGNSSVVPLNALIGIDVIDPTTSFPRRPYIDWELVSEPLTYAANQSVHYAAGKTFGGSSAFNTLSYIRSNAGAYQLWADTVGDDSYTFDNLLPYFKKSVNLTAPNLAKRNAANATPEYDASDFGNGGPLQVSWNNWVDPTLSWLAAAFQAAGLTINPQGFSSGNLNGSSWLPSTIDPTNATRSSSQTSYLNYALGNTDIKVYPHSNATKVLFDGTTATGVSVSTNGTSGTYVLSANKEVIVSGGVFHSPQILMVSGVGPSATLEANNIDVIADLPGVGQNLQDPLSVNVLNFVTTPNAQAIVADPDTKPEALAQYYQNASGPYSSVAGYMAFNDFSSDIRSTIPNNTLALLDSLPSDWPDIEHVVGTVLWTNGSSVGAISSVVTAPSSKGSITINSSSILDQPVIDLGWFSNSTDGDILVAGIKHARQIWNTTPAESIRISTEEFYPGDATVTDEEILEYVKVNAQQLWHASSTCAMGKSADDGAVVDANAKVFGVSNLRVVDISIFPFSLPGHPQASVYALAEKIAQDIKDGN